MRPDDHAIDRIVRYFEELTPQALASLPQVYAPDAWFKDPFNDVRGLAQIDAVFRHMYQSLDQPRFVVTRRLAGDGECFLCWDFHFRFRGKSAAQVVHGASHLLLDEQGRITSHRDYWDAAEELYEKLPLLGSFMRWIKRRARA